MKELWLKSGSYLLNYTSMPFFNLHLTCAKHLALIFLVLCTACSVPRSKAHVTDKSIDVLFVGNSLTYANDLPGLLENLAMEKGFMVNTQMIAKPNYALSDHLAEGQIQSLLNYRFDYMIVQQGPSSQEEGRLMLLDACSEMKKLCDQHGTKLMVFMVWPAYANYTTFEGVIQNYTEAAKKTNAILIPAGSKWKEITDKKDLSYYDSDLFHPSKKGSKMVADLIYEAIIQEQPDHMK